MRSVSKRLLRIKQASASSILQKNNRRKGATGRQKLKKRRRHRYEKKTNGKDEIMMKEKVEKVTEKT